MNFKARTATMTFSKRSERSAAEAGLLSPDVLSCAAGVAGLGIVWTAVLVAPRVVGLDDESEFGVGFAVADEVGGCSHERLVGAVALRYSVKEVDEAGLRGPADGGRAEWGERNKVAVELSGPVDQTVCAGVGNQNVSTGAAKGAIGIG